ncbi:voltage-dependent calcium channel subunit alpha-2/delta-3 isoform X2 [Nematostella vectensis]|uniref:voltage-dependent calcium channel subunit alpha-2/delta-3 isoform X2 n=1 Tax=Nematostella vectensis TaxID=45351 RepID=UPI0020776824|nr:voltage-dependent calcium channel subunit alpha-2/delta-3 isoform X2 [Nematostella vectensis]
MAQAMKQHLEQVLRTKIQSVQTLSQMAEELNANYTYDSSLTVDNFKFYDSKYLEEADNFTLVEVPTFASIPVNMTYSTVHVPTDVYKGSKVILNSAKWTEGLDKYFRENMEKEPSLLWQLAGTSTGVYRAYPGYKWRTPNDKDMYDHRRRGWYIQGSSSPKDMVILLDLSGSMTGSKIAIVKLAATYLLDTLQENDFVNVVVFNKKAYMLCEYLTSDETKLDQVKGVNLGNCNDTLLQATYQNKKYLKNLVTYVWATEVANVDMGFVKAVEVLKKARNNNQTSSGCIQTINFFTDGVEDVVHKKTNDFLDDPEIQKLGIRVFGYLVGREKGSPYKPVQDIACRNKGYFYTIETLSDVRENISKYMSVLSRPLALTKQHPPTWTPIYLDQLGLGLMITVVAPIFDRRNKNNLLGVVGTDVALPQLTASVPFHEVGANGYGFATNNNGFILFHPLLKEGNPIPGSVSPDAELQEYDPDNPPNLDLADVELKNANLDQLSRSMIDRLTGNVTLKNHRLISKDLKRISPQREYHIFFTEINGTSYSSAVAIPTSSLYKMKFGTEYLGSKDDLIKSVQGTLTQVASWKICEGIVPFARNNTPRYIPTYASWQDIISNIYNDITKAKDLCDESLFSHLMFDASTTSKLVNEWNVVENDTSGVLSVFVGTSGGMVRSLAPGQVDPPVSRDMTREPVYERAADSPGTIVISAPYKHPDDKTEDDKVLNASIALTINKSGKSTVAAVVGIQMKDDAILQNIISGTEACADNETHSCYLIDEDAYVVASNQDSAKQEVGKSFGAVYGQVMEKMVNESLFQRFYFDDIQAKCSKQQNTASSAMRHLNPLMALSSYAIWWTQSLIWTLAQFNVFSLFSSKTQVLAEDDPSMISCTKRIQFFKANPDAMKNGYNPPNVDSAIDCNSDRVDCFKPYFLATAVPDTNLVLVIVKHCSKCRKMKMSTLPQQVENAPFTPPSERYRRLPQLKCYASSEFEDKTCSSVSSVTPLTHLLFASLLVFMWLLR